MSSWHWLLFLISNTETSCFFCRYSEWNGFWNDQDGQKFHGYTRDKDKQATEICNVKNDKEKDPLRCEKKDLRNIGGYKTM